MRILSPPLSVIESTLFDPSFGLIRRWIDGDPSLSADDLASLAADEEASALRRDLEDLPVEGAESTPMAPVAMPAHLAAHVLERVRASALWLSVSEPVPGLIVRVDKALGPDGPLGWDMAHPFAVLLSEPIEHPDIWYGWLMASEIDYAESGDLLLEESDQPVDPLAAMVQTWNPVHLYLPCASAALGRLSPERLAAVRDLANDMAEADPDPAAADPGTLVHRTTSSGYLVLTGSPLGYDADPRSRYQQLYFEAAGFVRAIARHVLAHLVEPEPQPWWHRLLGDLMRAAGAAGLPLVPVQVAALGEADDSVGVTTDAENPYRLGDLVELRLIASPQGDAVQLHVTLLRDEPLSVGVIRGERVRQQARITPEARDADIFIGADQALSLFVRDDADVILFSMGLGDVGT
ncbi:hypothetical protein THIOKS1860020 [Thiocapsa sp. KS1]|nr:hypothetical protein [Thiocapsa sp. KS1]CRI67851.1 hypothetical protein THIOKS1860020 [Thiocapsa sp. KS1]